MTSPSTFQVDCGSSISVWLKKVIGNLAPTSKTLIMWNKTSRAIWHNKNYHHESSKAQEIFGGVPFSDGKINPLDWSKSSTAHETSNITLE